VDKERVDKERVDKERVDRSGWIRSGWTIRSRRRQNKAGVVNKGCGQRKAFGSGRAKFQV
jgi:hypothetical protein